MKNLEFRMWTGIMVPVACMPMLLASVSTKVLGNLVIPGDLGKISKFSQPIRIFLMIGRAWSLFKFEKKNSKVEK